MRRSAFRPARLAAAAGLLLLLSVPALAADDDFELADALQRRGYTDLAQELYNSLLSDPKSTAARKAEGQYGLALLKYADARVMAGERNEKRRKPMEEVLKRFDEADAELAKFISDNPSHPKNLDAKLSRGKLLQDKAEYVNVCIELGWTPASSGGDWQKKVAEWFDTAIQLFKAAEDKALADVKALREAKKDNTDEFYMAHDRWGLVWLFRLAAMYGKGAALPKGDPAGTEALSKMIKEASDDYQWENGESVRGLWAIHYAGLGAAAMDKPGDAFSFLKTAASFTAEKDSSPPIQEITFQSYRELGKASLTFGRREKDDWPKKALEAFAKLPGGWPDWKKHPEGQRAGIVWCKLLEQAGQGDKALTLAQDIAKEAEKAGSPARFEVTNYLGDLLKRGVSGGSNGGGAQVALDPDMLRKIAMGKFRSQDFRGAIAAFQAVIANCDEAELRDKYAWEAWDYIGRCHGVNQRWYEAFLAFDVVEQAWRKDKANPVLTELTDETGWTRAYALNQLAIQTKDPADKAMQQQAAEDFTRDHPDAPRNKDAEQQVAEGKLRDAEVYRDDPAAYRAALTELYKLFEGLKKPANVDLNKAKLAQIQHKIAMADRSQPDAAALEKAVQLADAWLAEKRPDSTESAVRRNRDQGRRVAISVALSARADRAASLASKGGDASTQAHQDLLVAIDRHGEEFKSIATSGQTQLDNWRAEGLIGVQKVDDADQLVGKILETNPGSRNNLYLAALIGKALEDRAHQRKGVDDLNGYKQFMIRSARRREWFLDNAKLKDGSAAPRNPETVRTIAACYAEGEDFPKAEALYAEAQKSFETASDAAPKPEEKDALQKKARSCRIELIGLLVKQGKFDAAIPQLEKEIARDAKVRDAFLKEVQKQDLPDSKFNELIKGTDINRVLLTRLTDAYMKAPSKERLIAAVNFCSLIRVTTPKTAESPEDTNVVHGPEYIEYSLRRAEAYLMLAEYSKQPEHYRNAAAAITNAIEIPGYMESYEKTLPGAKKRGDAVVQKAADGLRKLGAK